MLNLNGEKTIFTFMSLQYLFVMDEMSISFWAKLPTMLNISVFLKIGITIIFLVLRSSIMPALILDLK